MHQSHPDLAKPGLAALVLSLACCYSAGTRGVADESWQEPGHVFGSRRETGKTWR